MHAYCISGTDTASVEEKVHSLLTGWKVSRFDVLTVEKEEEKKEISITQIRDMTKQLQLSPANGPFIVAIIKNAHLMTIPAQNAILKILEEPPAKAKIILTSAMTDALLPTIISRCERCLAGSTDATDTATSVTLESLFQLKNQRLSHSLSEINTLAETRDDALAFVDSALRILTTSVTTGKTSPYGLEKCTELAEILLKTRAHLTANVNPKLALDSAFL